MFASFLCNIWQVGQFGIGHKCVYKNVIRLIDAFIIANSLKRQNIIHMNKHPPPLQCLAPSHCRRETGDPQITSLPHSEGLNGSFDIVLINTCLKAFQSSCYFKKCHSRTWHRAKTNWCTDHGINDMCVFVRACLSVCLCAAEAAFFYCKAVFAESVPSQGFPKFWVIYRAQIFCQCIFSF